MEETASMAIKCQPQQLNSEEVNEKENENEEEEDEGKEKELSEGLESDVKKDAGDEGGEVVGEVGDEVGDGVVSKVEGGDEKVLKKLSSEEDEKTSAEVIIPEIAKESKKTVAITREFLFHFKDIPS